MPPLLPWLVLGLSFVTPAALVDRGQQAAAANNLEEAERLWKEALAGDPGYFAALFDLGNMYFRESRLAEARTFLLRAARASPKDFNTRYLFGATLKKLGDPENALLQWREALAIQPENQRLLQIMAVEYSNGRYFREAAALARRAVKLDGKNADVHFLLIKSLQDSGDDAAALEAAHRALALFPESARAQFEYGYQLTRKGDASGALPYLQAAMKLDPSYEEPFFFYGSLLVDQGRNEEAIPWLRTAIRNRIDYIPARNVLARALMNQHKWKEALDELKETVALDPKHPQPHLLLSQIYFRLGDEASAGAEKRISLRLRRENPAVLEAPQPRFLPAGNR